MNNMNNESLAVLAAEFGYKAALDGKTQEQMKSELFGLFSKPRQNLNVYWQDGSPETASVGVRIGRLIAIDTGYDFYHESEGKLKFSETFDSELAFQEWAQIRYSPATVTLEPVQ